MNTQHAFFKATLNNPAGPETEIWINVSMVTSIMVDAENGTHIYIGNSNTSIHVHESPEDVMKTVRYLSQSEQEHEPIYFGDE